MVFSSLFLTSRIWVSACFCFAWLRHYRCCFAAFLLFLDFCRYCFSLLYTRDQPRSSTTSLSPQNGPMPTKASDEGDLCNLAQASGHLVKLYHGFNFNLCVLLFFCSLPGSTTCLQRSLGDRTLLALVFLHGTSFAIV